MPFFIALERKMSANELLTTARNPNPARAQEACSREEPHPKLFPAIRIAAPCASGRFSGKPVPLPEVREQMLAHPFARRGRQEARRDDLVRVDVVERQRDGAGCQSGEAVS